MSTGESSKQEMRGKLEESYLQCGIYEGNLAGEKDATWE
jgi:hypothetical protein